MKVGIIAPISMLNVCSGSEVHYCLPKLLVESKEYLEYYQAASKSGRSLIIMDTKKVGWQREPEDIWTVLEALGYIKPDLVILPSVMYDIKASLETAIEFLEKLKIRNAVACLEGTNSDEVKECRRIYSKALPKLWAIPSHLYPFYKGQDLNGTDKIYIDNHCRLEEIEDRKGIIVTSLPVRLGLDGRLVSDPLPTPQSLTFYEEAKFQNIVLRNIGETLEYYDE